MADVVRNWREDEDEAKILERLELAKHWTKPWHDNIKKWRDLYDFHHYKKAPKEGEKQFQDPTYTNVVDLAVGILQANPVEFRAVSWEPDDEEGPDDVEKFLNGALQIANEREEQNLTFEVNMNFVRDGGACLYTVWDPELAKAHRQVMTLPDPESEVGVRQLIGYTQLPVLTKVVDPLEVFLLPGGPSRWSTVFRMVEMTLYDFEAKFGYIPNGYDGYNTAASKMQKKCEFVDYWRFMELETPMTEQEPDEETGRPRLQSMRAVVHAVLFDKKFVKEFEPKIAKGYDELPYKVQFFKPTLGNAPKGFHSIIKPLESTVSMLEEAINRRTRQIEVYSMLPMFVRAMAGHTVEVDTGFGNVPVLGPDEDIAFPQWPGNAPDVAMHIEFIRSRIAQSGFSDIMFGGSASETSGYALSLMSDQNRIRLEQPVAHLELLWGAWGRHLLHMVRSFARDSVVRVYGRMKGDDFAEQIVAQGIADYLVTATVRPEFPNEQARKHAMAVQVKGILADSTIMERYLSVKQPHDEEQKKLIQMARTHPAMQYYGLLSALQEMAENGDEAAKQTLASMEQGTIPGMQGGAQANPTNTGPTPGMMSATGQPTPQELGMPKPGASEMEAMAGMTGAAPGMVGGGAF